MLPLWAYRPLPALLCLLIVACTGSVYACTMATIAIALLHHRRIIDLYHLARYYCPIICG